MKTVLAISSQPVRGHVGLGAITPVLNAMGIKVLLMPTVLISNHPGHRHGAGLAIAPAVLEEMVDALDANGWLGEVDAVISGYLPSAEHVEVSSRIVRRLAAMRDIIYLCDPVIGDVPKGIYVPEDAAEAIRDRLIALADAVTPNAFELGWLTGIDIVDARSAGDGAQALSQAFVAATSVPCRRGIIATVMLSDGEMTITESSLLEGVPHGTGDLFSALLLGHALAGKTWPEAGVLANEGVATVIEASIGADELRLLENLPVAVGPLQAGEASR